MALAGVFAAACPHPALSQGSAGNSGQQVVSVDIPAGDLSHAVRSAAQAAGYEVVSGTLPAAGARSNAANGAMTGDQALARILAGSGYTFSRSGRQVSIVRIPAAASSGITLGPVRVAGRSQPRVPATAMIDNLPPALPGGQVARGGQLGMLGNRDVMNTPFNETSYTSRFIETRQIRSIRDALKDDPSVRSIFTTGTAGVERIQIRGFNVDSVDMTFGGLYAMMPFAGIGSEFAERVEVLRGPAALLAGMSPSGVVGGIINVVPKRAADTPLTRIEAEYASDTQFGGHADLGRRFGKEKQLGVRLNGVIRSGATALPYNSVKMAQVVSGVDLRLRHVRLSTDFGFQQRDINGVLPYFALAAKAPVPDASRVRPNINLPWSYYDVQDIFGVFRGEVDLFRDVTAYGSVGVHDYKIHGAYTQSVTVNDVFGNASGSTNGLAQNGRYLNADLGVRAKVKTGPITQELNLSANRLDLDMGRIFGANNDITPYKFNIYHGPDRFTLKRSVTVPASSPRSGTSTLSSLAFADTLSALNNRIQITAGLRAQRVQSGSYTPTTGARTAQYDKTAVSPAVMAVFKPLSNVSIYGNWIQGLQQGTTVANTYANAGEIFAPYKTTQYEVGIKADLKRFIVSMDVFQITQPSTVLNQHTNVLSLNGDQRNRGLEMNIAGQIVHSLSATGGIMLLNPIMTHTQGGQYNGQRAANTAPVNFNMGLNYDLPFIPHASVTSDIVYTASEYIENSVANRRSIPNWVRLDLGGRYEMKNPASSTGHIALLLNVDNVTNARYYNSSGVGYISINMPRTFRFSISADF